MFVCKFFFMEFSRDTVAKTSKYYDVPVRSYAQQKTLRTNRGNGYWCGCVLSNIKGLAKLMPTFKVRDI